jgi:hypothetical protein
VKMMMRMMMSSRVPMPMYMRGSLGELLRTIRVRIDT